MPDRLSLRLFCTVCACLVLFQYAFSQAPSNDFTYQQTSSLSIYVNSLCKEVIESGKTTDKLTENDLASLPIGIARETPSGPFVIAIDSAYSTDRGWFFSAYASVTLPGTTQPIAFAAKNIGFNNGGLSTSSQVKLMLVSAIRIPLNENVLIELPADGRNFLEWDCNGFKSVNLKGNFIFSDGTLEPDTDVVPNQTAVTASFEINTGDLHNILMAVNITPFKIKGLKDLSFEVRNATADFSDIANPAGFSFPQEYQQSFGANIVLWRGFFLSDVSIRIKGFAAEGQKDPTISARNLLIDDLGVSGLFTASNLLALQGGSANGWPLSVDQLSVKLKFSKLTGGSLAGLLSVPFLGDEPVPYTAQMEQVESDLNYRFSLATGEDKEYPTPFSATLKIKKGSIIAVERKEGKFFPSTKLQGSLKIKGKLLKIDEVKFQDLALTSEKPYILGGKFSLVTSGEPKSNGFPIRLTEIKMAVAQGEAAISFHAALNLMNASDKGFAAETTIQLLAGVEEKLIPSASGEPGAQPTKKQEWKFKKVKINDIVIGAGQKGTTAIAFNGKLSVYNDDPVYGDGFRGSIDLTVRKILENGIKVNAYFGSKDTYRYWHVDAYVPAKVPLVAPLYISGFMGGASYKMVRQQKFVPDFNKIGADVDMTDNKDPEAGIYLPDETAGLSLMAGVTLIAANDAAVNADAMLELTFNQGGGLRSAAFTGTAFFFVPTKSRGRTTNGKAPSAPVYASLNMLFDNDNDVFHANLKTYLNFANVIKGVGPNNLVGEAVIHVDKQNWYFYVGRPSQMFGVDIAKLAVAQTYFMIGSQIEPMPPPPPEVLEVIDDIDPGSKREPTSLKGGRGFATGAHFRIGFDSKDKLRPFYILVAIGAGADIMLMDYGDAQCKGRSGPIGMDGWYASGQAYVFLKGKVGIRVKRKDFDILSLGAAALLQAKLPNPTWMKGQLAGKYSVLGGLVKGKFNLKMEVGEQCEIINQGSEIEDIQVISDLKPDANAVEVNVFSAPQVSFNTAMETDFSMRDLNDNTNAYRIRMETFALTGDKGEEKATIEWNAQKDVAILRTQEILPPQSKLKARVRVYWEKKSDRGIWEVMKENGQIAYEIKESSFSTGAAPDFIPEENVAYSYPVRDQYNFHISESGTGYVKLKLGQAYLFESTAENKNTFIARFEDISHKRIEVPLTYNVSQRVATFTIPQNLSRQAIYKLFFVKIPASTGAIDKNLTRADVKVDGGEDNETTVASNTLDGTLTQSIEKELYSTVFRTSQFGTFSEKWNSLTAANDAFDVAQGYVAVIAKRVTMQETFDDLEIQGLEGKSAPLVQAVASPEAPWMKNIISPLLYNSYPIDKDVTISWRDPAVLGVKPLRGVTIFNADRSHYRLEKENVDSGVASSKSGGVTIGYFLSYYSFFDYRDLVDKAAARFLNGNTSGVALLNTRGYTDLTAGDYPVEVTYRLPGTNEVTFRKEISIKF